MNNKLKYSSVTIVLLGAVAWFGPKVSYDGFDNLPLKINIGIDNVEQYVKDKEAKVVGIKPDNESRIVWADSVKQTEYAVVYLHGFSASQGEGMPIHTDFAKRYGCNLYLPRLAFHGLEDKDAFKNFTPKELVISAKEAIAVGKTLGKKVILMSCSTGGTLSVYLAANDPEISSLLLFSPNIDIADKRSGLLTGPWGSQMVKLIENGDYHSWEAPKEAEKYWYLKYRNEGVLALKYLINHTMTDKIFQEIKQPVYLAYYYKDDQHQDNVVSVERMKYFFDKISTPKQLKKKTAFPNADTHMIPSGIFSKQIPDIEKDLFDFTENVLHIPAK